MQLPGLDNFLLILAFVIPGFVTFQAIRLFSVPIAHENRDFILAYVTLSALNFAIAGLLIPIANSESVALVWRVGAWAAYVFIVPFLTGIILGTLIQRNFLIWLFSSGPLRWLGIKPINHVPTAWDWKFGQTGEQFVLLMLKDGTQFTGLLGTNSFISSKPAERDLYLQRLYERDDQGNWKETEKSLYVAKDEIRTVEFWPVD